ncbi:MAG: hypothetical protein ACRD3D_11030 [Terriglobia bacterium]
MASKKSKNVQCTPDAPATPKTAESADEPKVYVDVAKLPGGLKEIVEKELRDGGSFEEIAALVSASGQAAIEPTTIERFFRKDVKLQGERFAGQLAAARELKRVLGSKPDSPQSDLAFSVLMMGLSGLSSAERRSAATQAMRLLKDEREARLKTADAQRQDKKLGISATESRQRVRAIQVKVQMAKVQLDRLKQLIDRHGDDKALPAEIIQQINEVYGIVTAPEIQINRGADGKA